jgi:hypothetical protein
MRHELIVRFSPTDEFTLHCADPMAAEVARAWLDQAFTQFDCEPARASGKLLTVDRILAVADAAGPKGFADAAWADAFARAALGATGRSPLCVNLENQTVT